MQRTSAHLHFKFFTDFVLCVLFWSLLLIFCSSERTALHEAASAGHEAICELLIAGNADVNAKDGCAFTFQFFCWCCVVCFCFWSLLLIFCFSHQHTALHEAASYHGWFGDRHTELCTLLINGNADVNAKDRCAFVFWICSDFVLFLVVELCFWFSFLVTNAPLCIELPETVTVLTRKTYASCWLQAKLTWMQRTSAHYHFECALILFCFEFCFWSLLLIYCSSDQRNALHEAAYCGDTALCELLIKGNADVDAKDKCAFTFQFCCWFCVVCFVFEVCF